MKGEILPLVVCPCEAYQLLSINSVLIRSYQVGSIFLYHLSLNQGPNVSIPRSCQGHLEKSPLPGFPGRGGSSWDMSLTQLNHGELGFFEVPSRLDKRIVSLGSCSGFYALPFIWLIKITN